MALVALFLPALFWSFTLSIPAHFTLPKLIVLAGFSAATSLLCLVLSARLEWHRVPLSVIVPLAGFLVWSGISSLSAAHVPTAFLGLPDRHNGLLVLLICAALFVVAASLRLSRHIACVLRAFQWSLVPVAGYAVLQFGGLDPLGFPYDRPASTIGHPVTVGALLGLALPFTLVEVLRAQTGSTRVAHIAVFGMLFAGLIATLSRGPWIGVAAGLMLILFCVGRDRGLSLRPLYLTAGVTTAVAGVAVAVALLVSPGRLESVSERLLLAIDVQRHAAVSSRMIFYRTAVDMARDHAVVGVGPENFAVLYPRYRLPEAETLAPDVIPTMVHNGYLQWATTVGMPGLVLYLAFCGGLLLTLSRRVRHLASADTRAIGYAFVAALLAYAVQDLSGWLDITLSAAVWLLAGLGLAWVRENGDALTVGGRRHPLAASLLGVTGVVVSVLLLADAMVRLRGEQWSAQAAALDPVAEWAAQQDLVARSVSIARSPTTLLDRAGLLYLQRLAVAPDPATYQTAASLFARAHEMTPHDPYVLLHRVTLETLALQQSLIAEPSSDALAATERALALDRFNGSVRESSARLLLAARRVDEARAEVQQAIRLRPGLWRYHVLLGDIELAVGRTGAAASAYRDAAIAPAAGTLEHFTALRRAAGALAAAGDAAAARELTEALATRESPRAVDQSPR